MKQSVQRRLKILDAHHRVGISMGFALAGWVCFSRALPVPMQIIVGWNAFAVSLLTLDWILITTAKAAEVSKLASIEHSSRKTVLLTVLVAACASLATVGYLIGTAKGLAPAIRSAHALAAIGTVVISWVMVHTMFTLFYGYLFYREASSGGLSFPGCDKPDYHDFAYFSFVIGMTSQVSDVQITSTELRRWALLHGIVSFGFNAAILAVTINMISGLL